MQFANVNGVTLHHQVIGAGEGRPTIVFVNSLGTDFRIWRDVVVALAGEAAIVTYDKRGHGLSDIGASPYAMADHVGDLAGLLDRLEINNAVICGVSVGGMIAQGLHAARPDLVRALILCDTAHKIGDAALWNGRIDAVMGSGIESLADGIMELWFTPAFRTPDNPAYAGYRNMLVRAPVGGYVGTCAALRDTDYTEVARNIAVPTLCLVGDRDGSTPPDLVASLAALVPGARFEVIADAGHLPMIEQPEPVVALIREVLAGLAANGGSDG